MTRQWIRQVSISVGGQYEFSSLRCRFEVKQQDIPTPNHCNVIVTNLSEATAQALLNGAEHKVLTVSAGYPGNYGVIFVGNIMQVRKGRENPTDTYLAILATNELGTSFGVVSKTLPKGHKFDDQVQECLKALSKFGVSAGHITQLGGPSMPRARSLFGMAAYHLTNICRATGASWSIQDNKLQILKHDEALPGGPIVLNSMTGLIGMPTQTIQGIEARCLLNPRIKVGSLVKIDQASINRMAMSPNPNVASVQQVTAPNIAADGIYKVFVVEHQGDTRGQPWYTDIVAIRRGDAPTQGLSGRIGQRDVGNPSAEGQ